MEMRRWQNIKLDIPKLTKFEFAKFLECKKRRDPILTVKPETKPVLSAWYRFLRSLGLSSVRNRPRTNLGFADPRSGFEHTDIEIPVEELVREGSKWFNKQPKLLATQALQRIKSRVLLYDRMARGTVHGESVIKYVFKTDDDLAISDRGSAIFEGTLSTRLVKDGRTERTGWCSMRSLHDKKAFNRKNYFMDWNNYTHLLIKCRGDGRTYKVMLHIPQYFDVTWGDSYSFLLHTHGGPHWQFEMIPFSRFIYTIEGRIMDVQYSLDPRMASSIGITLMDRINGPFRLEIDFIGATHHISHLEKHAYETYNTPLGNTLL
uniref:NADH:ubiquinone oxidoreductase intermediate-associated protein 30 domain-containing protein n=1 Tax=Globodera rostochiensis TaxID=31243 RepID=A0A914HGC6_GLORO